MTQRENSESKEWPTIRKRGSSYQVDCGTKLQGVRVQKQFATKREAQEFARQARAELKLQQRVDRLDRQNRVVLLQNLTDSQRADIAQAIEMLRGRATLSCAVDYYLKHAKPDGQVLNLESVVELYLTSKARGNLRPRSLRDMKDKLGRLCEGMGALDITVIGTSALEEWLDSKGYKGASRDSYRRQFFGLFSYAQKHGYCLTNPAALLERPIRDQTLPGIHTVLEVEKIMRAAVSEASEMVPYFALGYFAGLRPAELFNEDTGKGLDWQSVDLGEGLITVSPEVAKKRRQRHVTISSNLHEWLIRYGAKSGSVYFSRSKYRRVREVSGVAWSHDVMRHSFGSYHYAQYKDAAKTAAEMGHTNPDVLFSHYRNLVRPAQAEKYWKIRPKAAGKLLKLA